MFDSLISKRHIVIAFIVSVATFLLLFLRRSDLILNPQVWSEDGFYIIPQFLEEGWLTLLVPVQGYLVTTSRLISNVVLTMSPENYPLFSTALSWFFIASVMCLIALSPTMLRGKAAVALSCLLIPTDPETFGTPLYSFWWAGLVLAILPLWERSPKFIITRLLLLIICGLSSPLISLITPLMAIRAWFFKERSDFILFFVALVCLMVQMAYIFGAGNGGASIPSLNFQNAYLIVEKFFGFYLSESRPESLKSFISGLALISLIL
jgi:hypothetical protein